MTVMTIQGICSLSSGQESRNATSRPTSSPTVPTTMVLAGALEICRESWVQPRTISSAIGRESSKNSTPNTMALITKMATLAHGCISS